MKTVTCPICGKSFSTNRPNKKFCSFGCREAGKKLWQLEWEAKHRDYRAKYMKEYRAQKKES